jgi:hypothetical protein
VILGRMSLAVLMINVSNFCTGEDEFGCSNDKCKLLFYFRLRVYRVYRIYR